MLTQAESGLSAPDYAFLRTADKYGAYTLTAHKFTPNWTAIGAGIYESPVWNGGDYIFSLRFNIGGQLRLQSYQISTGTVAFVVVAGNVAGDEYFHQMYPPSLAFGADGNLHVFYQVFVSSTSRKIVENAYTIALAAVSGPTNVYTPANILNPIIDWMGYTIDYHRFNAEVSQYTGPQFSAVGLVPTSKAEYAFDENSANVVTTVAATCTLTVDFTRCLDTFGYLPFIDQIGSTYTIQATGLNSPKTWTAQCSADGVAWTTVSTVASSTAWGTNEVRSFVTTVAGPANSKYLRIVVTAANAATFTIEKIKFRQANAIVPVGGIASGIGQLHLPYPAIQHMVAVDQDTLYVIRHDSGTQKYVLMHVVRSGGTWFANDTSFVFSDPILGMDAVIGAGGTAGIVLVLPTPGVLGVTAIDGVTYRYLQYNVSAIFIKMLGATTPPQDHVEILSIVPKASQTTRNELQIPRITYANGQYNVVLGFYQSAGTAGYLYTSSDGVNWSEARLRFPSASRVLVCGNNLFSVSGQADCTLMFGNSAPASQIDLSNRVGEISISRSPNAQFSTELSNEDDFLTNHTWLRADNIFVVEPKFGYYPVDGLGNPVPASSPVMVSMGKFLVESFALGDNLPEKTIVISGRDYSAFMTDYVVAPEARYFNSQLIGGDTFENVAGTNFGGLAHTAVQGGAGVWSAANGNLIYTPPSTSSARFESPAFSTLSDSLAGVWNGSAEIGFTLNDNTLAKAGIVFRGIDKDYYWSVMYDSAVASDKIGLYETRGGITTLLVAGAALSWRASVVTTPKYFRIKVRYNQLIIFTSTDGITFTVYTTTTINSLRAVGLRWANMSMYGLPNGNRFNFVGPLYRRSLQSALPESGAFGPNAT